MPAHFTPTPRIRRSPYFDATVAAGVTSFTVYNHMYMPTGFGDPMGEYWLHAVSRGIDDREVLYPLRPFEDLVARNHKYAQGRRSYLSGGIQVSRL